ncbi:hypothetical protein SSPS47_07340 [Streptomyces sp. S4.7]|uniref:hypothetical protein n=1 Tax=Streptomyces sp. S4.7 TaxID=2705439 RepID=UPI001398371A|nr:hypothetical protein [Streptomyces sp. S4.7]QHY94933.1 hypothetical protein SSPS47_07340 [Streptomyces sp. S4.7]
MEAELVTLAAAGATALVQQMATDGWTAARDRMVAFFARRGSATPASVEEELDTVRAELVAAQRDEDEQLVADVQAEWRTRLRRALAADPAAAAELRSLLDELAPATPVPQHVTSVHNTVNGGVVHGAVVQAGAIGTVDLGGGGSRGGAGSAPA